VNEIGDKFYIIHSGHVQVSIVQNNEFLVDKVQMKPVAELHTGDSFGELALINDKPRAATISAILPTFCIILTKKMFKKAIEDLNEGKYKPIVEFLRQTPIF
jgi:ATP-binding cassette subfamily B protein